MNVKDVASPPVPGSLKEAAEIMLRRQTELEDHYWVIEKRPCRFVSISDRYGQTLIKDFLWRITEEIGEALEAYRYMDGSRDKVYEELADALHFVLGLCSVTDHGSQFIQVFSNHVSDNRNHYYSVALFVEEAGVLGNTLKLKPWKQTDMLTDKKTFIEDLDRMIGAFLGVCESFEMNWSTLFDFYWRKSQVNFFRIRSNY